MIRINWSEVEAVKERLLRDGVTDSFELIIIVFYHNKSECDKFQVKLIDLGKALFDLADDSSIRGLYVYDLAMKRPFLKCETPDRASALETVPNSGHVNVIRDFGKMIPEAREVWIEIAFAELQHQISQGV